MNLQAPRFDLAEHWSLQPGSHLLHFFNLSFHVANLFSKIVSYFIMIVIKTFPIGSKMNHIFLAMFSLSFENGWFLLDFYLYNDLSFFFLLNVSYHRKNSETGQIDV